MKFKFLRQIFTNRFWPNRTPKKKKNCIFLSIFFKNPPPPQKKKKKIVFYFLDHYIHFCLVIKSHQHTSAFLTAVVVGALALVTSRTKKKTRPWSFEALSRLSSPSSLIWSQVWLNFFFLQLLMMSFLYLRFVIFLKNKQNVPMWWCEYNARSFL